MNYIYYHGISSVTGKELKRVLGIDGGTGSPNERPTRMIRWGNSEPSRFRASVGTLNSSEALKNAANKERALTMMAAANVNIPPSATRFDGELLIGRTAQHTQGSGAFFITSQRDFDLARRNLGCTHFMSYIPTEREYRVHVFNNKVIAIAEKRMTDHCTNLQIRNHGTGWIFNYMDGFVQTSPEAQIALRAVQSLGLSFGAVDVIKGVSGNLYILEVNSAPSLVQVTMNDEPNSEQEIVHGPAFDIYVEHFTQWLSGNGNI